MFSNSLKGLGLVVLVCVAQCNRPQTEQSQTLANDHQPTTVAKVDLSQEPISVLVAPSHTDSQKVALGEKLFNDTRLSKDNTLSCASCHGLNQGGTDLKPVSTGVGGAQGPINSPTVFNSSLNFVQFWDGRAKDLKEQAAGPVANPLEMGSSWDEVIAKIQTDPDYIQAFAQVYQGQIKGENIADAIAAFEETLITTNSRFDQWLLGNDKALTEQEKLGYEYFKGYGCTTCHNGPNVGGNSFQKVGLVKDYFSVRGNIQEVDYGRYNVTKQDEDKHKFKVPSLRLVALTPPYFHDASQKTLQDAVKTMAWHQLGMELKPEEIDAIVAFLKTLPGEYKGKALYP